MSRVFIAGAGTGVGKTLVSCLLTAELIAAGCRMRTLKPVETGFDAARPHNSDGALLLRAQGLPVDQAHLRQVTGWHFAAPLSPDMAAAREQRRVDFDALLAFCADTPGCVTLIEGVGGVMAPLDEHHTVLDWMQALNPAVVLVTGSYLGALSHTLTAITALATRGLKPAAIVISESADQPVPAARTADTLERFVDGIPLVVLPRLEKKAGAARAPELLPLMVGLRGTIADGLQRGAIRPR